MRKLIITLAAAASALAVLTAASPASASIVPHAVTGGAYSDHLAGYQLVGNHGDRYRDARALVLAPAETSAVPADTIVAGFTSADNISGGFETGIGLVLDDTAQAPSCHADQWVVEAGTGFAATPMPLPASALSPLLRFGLPVCVSAGSSRYLESYYSTTSRVIHFREGPSAADNDQVGTAAHPDGQYIGWHNFETVGFGADTATGAAAATLTAGSVTALSRAGVTQYNGTRRLIETYNNLRWTGTLTGGAPSVANPVTLLPSALGTGFAVTAP